MLRRAVLGGSLLVSALADVTERALDARVEPALDPLLVDAAADAQDTLVAELAQERLRGKSLERRVEALERLLEQQQQAAAAHSSRGLAAVKDSDVEALERSLDHVWLLGAGLICFFLQAGFGMLEAGAIRAKNAKSIMLKNLMDACIGGFVFYLFGYGLAYGRPETPNVFVGWGNFALSDASDEDYLHWFFQFVFAATIATIVSGAVAERIQFTAYMIYSAVLTGVIYPIAAHWIWCQDGFLYKLGVIDYAGGGAVHTLSGVAALMGAMALGPRHGRFVGGKPVVIPPHDTSMMGLGVFILMFGFIPFNAGSGMSIVGGMAGQTARIAVITMLGGCSGAITSLFVGLLKEKHSSLEYCMNGAVAGMVSVCSCCAVVRVWAVLFVIAPLAALSFWLLKRLQEKLQIDDPLCASCLHFGPGMVGLLHVGLLADPEYVQQAYGCEFEYRSGDTCDDFKGLFYGGSGKQLGVQLLAAAVWTAWGLVTCSALFYGMNRCGVLRVALTDELEGLDIAKHGGAAYHCPQKKYATAAPPSPTASKTLDGPAAEPEAEKESNGIVI